VPPNIYKSETHKIDKNLIDKDALSVIQKLRESGYSAYLVGGSVRDLLLGHVPKDYDISTAATPEEIKRLFQKRCILIGRRFRLAHIRFGKKVFEVATFRSGEDEADLIVRDNQWGTEESDVSRRDFTMNGLFYDPLEESVIDYIDGLKDVQSKLLRTIGNPFIRFKQDPVRMIRLLKFRARFGFTIDQESRKALLELRREILKSSSARVLEELLRMLESSAAAPFFKLMTDSYLLELLLPTLSKALKGEHGKKIYTLLKSADKVNLKREKHPLSREVLLSCFIAPLAEETLKTLQETTQKDPNLGDVIMVVSKTIHDLFITPFHHFPRRLSSGIQYILTTQYRLTPFSKKKHFKPHFFDHNEFHNAFLFYQLRAICNESLREGYLEWKKHYENHIHKKTPV
jgi:poly(A) polymerase